MLTTDQLLRPLSERRTDEVVVTTMSVVRPWGRISTSSLDFASADSAMGHAADLALGVALSRPDRRVLCLNGDGSMLMALGTLATVVEAGVENLVLLVVNNRGYEITGRQPVPAAGVLDYAGLARAAGFRRAHTVDSPDGVAAILDDVFQGTGPILVDALVKPGAEGPIRRSPDEEAPYLGVSLYDWARTFRAALAAGPR